MAESEQNASGADAEGEAPAKKKGLMGPLMIGLAAALLLGGGAAYAVMSGLAPIGAAPTESEQTAKADAKAAEKKQKAEEQKPPAFVPFEPLTITLTHGGAPRQLRLGLSVETNKDAVEKVEMMMPRMLDALNTLLRSMDERELTEPAGFDRLRAQMLRRLRIAAGPSAVKDLLVTEFVVF